MSDNSAGEVPFEAENGGQRIPEVCQAFLLGLAGTAPSPQNVQQQQNQENGMEGANIDQALLNDVALAAQNAGTAPSPQNVQQQQNQENGMEGANIDQALNNAALAVRNVTAGEFRELVTSALGANNRATVNQTADTAPSPQQQQNQENGMEGANINQALNDVALAIRNAYPQLMALLGRIEHIPSTSAVTLTAGELRELVTSAFDANMHAADNQTARFTAFCQHRITTLEAAENALSNAEAVGLFNVMPANAKLLTSFLRDEIQRSLKFYNTILYSLVFVYALLVH
ncbi:hypothetical protein niasHT_008922 [Heterodera trifolii]|uniref:Uncharacterized protein n=1 Tax=Heterodera trifolii TaxID=157864 RepID=A0ABD2LY48_9BILA